MRFMMLMISAVYSSRASDAMPSVEAIEAMTAYNKEMKKAGVLLSVEGLHAPTTAVRIRFEGGTPTITNGPFPEAKDVPGGYWIIDVASREKAIG